jgi:hypothetical protein
VRVNPHGDTQMTERDTLNAILKVVCALAEKLTGQRLAIHMRMADGQHRWLTSDDSESIIDWLSLNGEEAAEPLSSPDHSVRHKPS